MKTAKSGFREFSDHSVNIQRGCEANCRYCFARYDAVCRFQTCTKEQWPMPLINQKKVDRPWRGTRHGVIAYPSTHDISTLNLSEYLCVLRKLLDARNRVLITTKARWSCIPTICEAYQGYKKQIEFMFTIGSSNDDVLRFWEPGASGFEERLRCLQYAYETGFTTNVLCEPFLDGWALDIYNKTKQFITGNFWLGKVRQFERRVNLDGVTEEQMQKYVLPLKHLQNDECVLEIASSLMDKEKVQFKESVVAVIDRYCDGQAEKQLDCVEVAK